MAAHSKYSNRNTKLQLGAVQLLRNALGGGGRPWCDTLWQGEGVGRALRNA